MRELDNILSAALDKIAQIKDSYSIERRLPGGCDYVDQDFSSTSRQNSPVLDRTKNRYHAQMHFGADTVQDLFLMSENMRQQRLEIMRNNGFSETCDEIENQLDINGVLAPVKNTRGKSREIFFGLGRRKGNQSPIKSNRSRTQSSIEVDDVTEDLNNSEMPPFFLELPALQPIALPTHDTPVPESQAACDKMSPSKQIENDLALSHVSPSSGTPRNTVESNPHISKPSIEKPDSITLDPVFLTSSSNEDMTDDIEDVNDNIEEIVEFPVFDIENVTPEDMSSPMAVIPVALPAFLTENSAGEKKNSIKAFRWRTVSKIFDMQSKTASPIKRVHTQQSPEKRNLSILLMEFCYDEKCLILKPRPFSWNKDLANKPSPWVMDPSYEYDGCSTSPNPKGPILIPKFHSSLARENHAKRIPYPISVSGGDFEEILYEANSNMLFFSFYRNHAFHSQFSIPLSRLGVEESSMGWVSLYRLQDDLSTFLVSLPLLLWKNLYEEIDQLQRMTAINREKLEWKDCQTNTTCPSVELKPPKSFERKPGFIIENDDDVNDVQENLTNVHPVDIEMNSQNEMKNLQKELSGLEFQTQLSDHSIQRKSDDDIENISPINQELNQMLKELWSDKEKFCVSDPILQIPLTAPCFPREYAYDSTFATRIGENFSNVDVNDKLDECRAHSSLLPSRNQLSSRVPCRKTFHVPEQSMYDSHHISCPPKSSPSSSLRSPKTLRGKKYGHGFAEQESLLSATLNVRPMTIGKVTQLEMGDSLPLTPADNLEQRSSNFSLFSIDSNASRFLPSKPLTLPPSFRSHRHSSSKSPSGKCRNRANKSTKPVNIPMPFDPMNLSQQSITSGISIGSKSIYFDQNSFVSAPLNTLSRDEEDVDDDSKSQDFRFIYQEMPQSNPPRSIDVNPPSVRPLPLDSTWTTSSGPMLITNSSLPSRFSSTDRLEFQDEERSEADSKICRIKSNYSNASTAFDSTTENMTWERCSLSSENPEDFWFPCPPLINHDFLDPLLGSNDESL